VHDDGLLKRVHGPVLLKWYSSWALGQCFARLEISKRDVLRM
jgi:hypothetical protein